MLYVVVLLGLLGLGVVILSSAIVVAGAREDRKLNRD